MSSIVRLCFIISLINMSGIDALSPSTLNSPATSNSINSVGQASKRVPQVDHSPDPGRQHMSSSAQFTPRQVAHTTGAMMSFLSSIIPGVVNSLMPLAVLFGLGALAVPALGLGMLLRESRRRSYQGPTVAESIIEFYEQMSKLIENAERKYKQANKINQY